MRHQQVEHRLQGRRLRRSSTTRGCRRAATSCTATASTSTAASGTARNTIQEFSAQADAGVIGEIHGRVHTEIHTVQRSDRVPLSLLATDRAFFDFQIGTTFDIVPVTFDSNCESSNCVGFPANISTTFEIATRPSFF